MNPRDHVIEFLCRPGVDNQGMNHSGEHIFINASIEQRVDAISIILTSALAEVAEP